MGVRRRAREAVLQALYMADTINSWSVEEIDSCIKNFAEDSAPLAYSSFLSELILTNRKQIDSIITQASAQWSIARMSRVDRNILRIGVCEILFAKEVPSSVAINEAIEIAKKYSSDDSPMFINGVLDSASTKCKVVGIKPLRNSAEDEEDEGLESLPNKKVYI
jgi:transcription antitermination protein NusB